MSSLNTPASIFEVFNLCSSMMFSHGKMLWSVALPFVFYPQMSGAQSLSDIAQLFGVNRIVPDLLPSFAPSVLLEVSYNVTVIPGEIFSQTGIFPYHWKI